MRSGATGDATTSEPIWRHRELADEVQPATAAPAVDLGEGIWMSRGLSNSYLLRCEGTRVIVNCGTGFESAYHRAAFDAVDPSPVHTIILTQGHPDHFGGVDTFLEDGTQLVTQANFLTFRTDFEKLAAFRQRNASFAWGKQSFDTVQAMIDRGEEVLPQSSPTPTSTFDDEHELTIGGRTLRLISTPGGETTDSCVVWLPATRTAMTGNLFGPLFGHLPNLVTLRGDRYRDVADYIGSVQQVRDLRPARIITGHFDPIDGEELIDRELARLQEAARYLHDRVIDGMNAGKDVHTLMRDVSLPDSLDVGQNYGKVSWNVRAIWETHAGWFHHRSTTELYHVPAAAVAGDIVAAGGADGLRTAARAHVDAGRPLHAIHLTDILLTADAGDAEATAIAADAHTTLLAASTNFWEQAWLRKQLEGLGS